MPAPGGVPSVVPMTDILTTSPLAIVAAAYEAFGRGDVASLTELLADDIVFDDDARPSFAQQVGHPLLVTRRGTAGVIAFFQEFSRYELHAFEVTDLMQSDTHVAAHVLIEYMTPGGVRVADDEIHLWTVNSDGLVSAVKHYTDTAKHIAAMQGRTTP